jgi:DNA-binding transcriptional MerR regulator
MPPEARSRTADRLDDDDYPAFTMGRAAEMIGATPAFLRAIGEARLITPLRSEGGHRRYSRYQLRIAARARELVDAGTPVEAACRIIILEDQLEEALRLNEQLRQRTDAERAGGATAGGRAGQDTANAGSGQRGGDRNGSGGGS